MNTLTLPLSTVSRRTSTASGSTVTVRKPHYDCQERESDFGIVVYVPGVESAGIEITSNGVDLLINARKHHFVRVNFGSLNLEGVQHDYQLSLRLGRGLDYAALQAEFHQGILTLTIPKKQPLSFASGAELVRVA
ncbi:MAG: Hsp20/alpha crystallin family protein [Opitutus sp.]|nr:Hsp20/alpha crystallin family protein [Opitutus sp.]MCS6248104.1 Hsp20/alpha crystallin family protein [Opitutus sp.]MCS6274711.1 Hsp20/alpha crystallin family protein [Opitutus sp.]MCS6278020.1 Hsp20/alpha crystallin family protein [Opitutus sp.]MCS6298872.1 Hsp20/alpha crystallin family protein [Opitutus sp.]